MWDPPTWWEATVWGASGDMGYSTLTTLGAASPNWQHCRLEVTSVTTRESDNRNKSPLQLGNRCVPRTTLSAVRKTTIC
jgi:hypothetical protein